MSEAVKTVYAQALLEAVTEQGCGEAVLEDLLALQEAMRQNPSFYKFFCVPVIEKADKRNMVESILSGRVHPYTVNFLKVLIDAERFSALREITEEFRELYNRISGIERVRVSTARPLSKEQSEKLRAKVERMTGKQVRIEVSVDKSLLGGIVVDIGGKRIDNSLKSRLAQLGDAVSESVFQKKGE